MKIACVQKDLARGISIANRAVSPRSTVPIMTNMLLAASDNQLRISGTNSQLRIDCAIPCRVEESGSITIPARLFGEIITRLTDTVWLDVNHRTKTLNIQSGNYKAKINGIDADNFPSLPSEQPATSLSINAVELKRMIDQVAFAASTDPARLTLSGVNVEISDRRMKMAALNGYRLAVCGCSISSTIATPQAVIVPATSLLELSQALSRFEQDQAAMINIYRNRISFHARGIDVSSQTLDGKFPDYNTVIPRNHTTSVMVDAKMLIRSLQVARLLTKQDKNGIERTDLSIDPAASQLSISVSNAEVGDSGDTLAVESSGEPATITLSIGYVLDVLNRIAGDKAELLLTGNRAGFVIRMPNVPADDYIQVIMPIAK